MKSFLFFIVCCSCSCLNYFAKVECVKFSGSFPPGKEKKIGCDIEKMFKDAGGDVVFKYKCNDNGDPDTDVVKAREFLKTCISRFDKFPLRKFFVNCFLRTFFDFRYDVFRFDYKMEQCLKDWEKMEDKDFKEVVDKVLKNVKKMKQKFCLFSFRAKWVDFGCEVRFNGEEVEEDGCCRSCFLAIERIVGFVKSLELNGEWVEVSKKVPGKGSYGVLKDGQFHVFIKNRKDKSFKFEIPCKEDGSPLYYLLLKEKEGGSEKWRYKFLTDKNEWNQDYYISIEEVVDEKGKPKKFLLTEERKAEIERKKLEENQKKLEKGKNPNVNSSSIVNGNEESGVCGCCCCARCC